MYKRQTATELKAKFDNYHANLNVGAELKSSFKGLELQEEEGKDYVKMCIRDRVLGWYTVFAHQFEKSREELGIISAAMIVIP